MSLGVAPGALVAGLLGIYMLVRGLWQLADIRATLTEGHVAEGAILDKEIRERVKRNGHVKRSQWVRVQFPGSDGVPVDTWRDVTRSFYDQVNPGETRPLRYLPKTAQLCQFTDDPGIEGKPRGTINKGIFFLVIAGIIFAYYHFAPTAQ